MDLQKNHKCSLNLGSDSMLPKSYNFAFCRRLRKLCLVSEHHPESYRHFRSYTTLVAERQRHLSEGDTYIIHPFSLFSLWWKSTMTVVDILHTVVSTLRLAYVLDASPRAPVPHALDHVLLALHLVCMANIAVTFFFGYIEGLGQIVLVKTAIARHYIWHWFVVDLASCLPVSYVILALRLPVSTRYLLVGHILAMLRTTRICSIMENVKIFLQIFSCSYLYHASIQLAVLFILSVHWCNCIIYLSPVITHYWHGEFPPMYNKFMKWTSFTTNLTEYTLKERYLKGMFISLASFFGSSSAIFGRYQSDEMLIHSFVLLYGTVFMIYVLAYLIKVYLTKYNSLIRYHELMNQVKEYMKHRQFPVQLKKRVIAFYYYTYQGTYFREELVFDSLSEQLRNEITLHTCHKLVKKVALFEDLPASVVGSVLGCLHPEVYLPNDLVVRAGDFGDCMYFIANGTVAVYSLKGVEVCHLEDGEHFGEVALLMKDSKRVATVVAVEITQVYRLDAVDFRHFIVTYQILYQRIETMASRRMHDTLLLDDAFRRDREKLNESIQHGSTK